MADFPYVEWLAREYKRQAECSGLWVDYIKAHGLANFCVAKGCRESRLLVYEIEESWYSGRHPLSFKEHQQLIDSHKCRLGSYRDQVWLDYNKLQAKVATLVVSDIFSESNLENAESLAYKIFKGSKWCSEGLIETSAQIIACSVGILERRGLTASCNFAVIGLGSIAKGEATPYSDLEYGFIVERDDAGYFEKLAVDTYFRIGNLCETPLKHFDISELKVPKGEPPIISGTIAAGYRIDGLTAKAGNIPTGNGRQGSKTLTPTVNNLMELYKSSAVAPFDGMAGDMSDMLSSTAVIYTNEGQTSQLHRDFVKARAAFEKTKGKTKTVVKKKRWQSFRSDIDSYTFLPKFIKFQPPENCNIQVKTDIFRYPTLLANNIKMLMRWEVRYPWQVFAVLHKQGMLSSENYRYLNIVLAFSIYLRTSTYVGQKAQAEFLHFAEIMEYPVTFKCSSPAVFFVNMGNFLVPIKQSIRESVERLSCTSLSVTEIISEITQCIKVSKTDFLLRTEIFYFIGNYVYAFFELAGGIGKDLMSMECEQFIERIIRIDEIADDVQKYVELCGYLLYYIKAFPSAYSYLHWLIKHEKRNLGLLKLLTAHCKQEIGDYRGVKELVAEAKQQLEEEYGGSYDPEVEHEDIWTVYNSLGFVFCTMGEYKEALKYAKKAFRLNRSLFGEVNHLQTASSYNNIGILCKNSGDFHSAIEYFTMSLEMHWALFGFAANHEYIANNYCGLGSACRSLCKYDLSLEYHFKALEMREVVYGAKVNHTDTACSLLNIGNLYNDTQNYVQAFEYYERSLKMNKALYGATANHPDIALCYESIGNAYNCQGNYTLAREYHLKALDMKKVVFGEDTNHSSIAMSYYNIGKLLFSLGNYVSSLEYYTKASDMFRAIFGKHPQIVACEIGKAKAHKWLGNLCSLALQLV